MCSVLRPRPPCWLLYSWRGRLAGCAFWPQLSDWPPALKKPALKGCIPGKPDLSKVCQFHIQDETQDNELLQLTSHTRVHHTHTRVHATGHRVHPVHGHGHAAHHVVVHTTTAAHVGAATHVVAHHTTALVATAAEATAIAIAGHGVVEPSIVVVEGHAVALKVAVEVGVHTATRTVKTTTAATETTAEVVVRDEVALTAVVEVVGSVGSTVADLLDSTVRGVLGKRAEWVDNGAGVDYGVALLARLLTDLARQVIDHMLRGAGGLLGSKLNVSLSEGQS